MNVQDVASRESGFHLELQGNTVTITGEEQTGTLYGAYELLRMQGWRWFTPGVAGEIIPQPV
ncbi:hypothetical protein ACFSTH_14115 [Paenibacillus yanchengensis]|uniref:Uncharacterized protein n=1 Tax=Paenibacillus yanchengensis TaxID=2035833 RepID=A0ABW4YNU8_9BACL